MKTTATCTHPQTLLSAREYMSCAYKLPALTNCTVHFDWKENLVFSSACNLQVKAFQTRPFKIARKAVEHSTFNGWWVDLHLNKTLQLALRGPVMVAHIILVHLRRGL